MRLVGGGHLRLVVAVLAAAAAGLYAAPAFAGAPNVSWVSPSGGFVSPSTDFAASATQTGNTGVGAVKFEYSTNGTDWTTFATALTPGTDGNYHGIWNAPPAEGPYSVRAEAFDTSPTPLSSATTPVQVTLDTTGPSIDDGCLAQGGEESHACGWFTSGAGNVVVHLSTVADGAQPVSGAYTTDGSNPLTSPNAVAFDPNSIFDTPQVVPPNVVSYRVAVKDAAGNVTEVDPFIKWDDSPPPPPDLVLGAGSSNAYVQGTPSAGYTIWYQKGAAGSAVLTVPTNDDPQSGIGSVDFPTSVSGSVGWGVGTFTARSGTYTWSPNPGGPDPSFSIVSTNTASNGLDDGQAGPAAHVGFSPDPNPPTGGVTCVPLTCTNPNGPVQVTISPVDTQSGVQQVRYTTDGNDPTASTGTVGSSVLVTTPETVKFWGIDNVGNSIVMASQPVGQASDAPTVTIDQQPTGPTSDAKIQWSSTATGVTFRCRLKTADWIPFATCGSSVEYTSIPQGNYTFEVEAVSGGVPGPASTVSFTQSYGGSLPTALTRLTNAAVDSTGPSLAGTGETVAFASNSNLDAADLLQGGAASSVLSGSAPGDVAVSSDGRFVAFASSAAPTQDATPGRSQIYVYDRATQTTTLVSRATDGTIGNGDSTQPAISADGRYIVFTSAASNLGFAAAGSTQIYRRDLSTGDTELMSVSYDPGGGGCDADSQFPAISADGDLVAFQTAADNCVTNFSSGGDVVLRDVSADTTELANLDFNDKEVSVTGRPRMSADGRYVAFVDDGTGSVNVRDRQAGETSIVSGDLTSNSAPDISDDGNTIAFVSQDSGTSQVYVATLNGSPQLISRDSDGLGGNGDSLDPSLSRDGKYVAFDSAASNLVQSDANGATKDVFVAPTAAGGGGGGGQTTWNLATDLLADATGSHTNPFGPWEMLSADGVAHTPSTYHTIPASSYGTPCTPNIANWTASTSANTGINTSGSTITGNSCAPNASYPPHVAIAHPGASNLVIYAWHSPITGTVSITGGMADIDPGGGDGIKWSVDLGATTIDSGTIQNGGGSQTFASGLTADVTPSSTLYFIVDPNGDFSFDSTEVDVTIAETTATDAPQSSPFTVNSADDHDDGVCSVSDCTLREAINAANAGVGPQIIKFAIGSGPQTIQPHTPLPALTSPTTIDGTTQPGYLTTPVITIDGSDVVGIGDGLVIEGQGSTVRGLVIDNIPRDFEAGGGIGIHVLADGATIAGNYLGVDASGAIPAGNGGDGIRVENADDATIGGPNAADMNVVAGNGGHGIFLANSTGSTVEGNYSGFDVHGESAIPNGIDGIAVDGGGQNLIENNVSSGNTNQGISLFGVNFGTTSGDTVRGNDTGTAPFGDGLIPNGGDGILVASGTGHIVGGSASGQGNTSEGNGLAGVHLTNESGAVVAGNTISNNHGAGVQIDPTASNNTIGGDVATADGNTIDGNGGAGVSVFSSGNAIIGNSIDTNGGSGINLNGVGNALQPVPLVAAAQQSGTILQVTGKFLSPADTYRIEYFLSPTCGAQGVTFIGAKQAVVGAGGEIALTAKIIGLPAQLPGTFLTATATSSSNNTSTFSKCIHVTAAGTATSSSLALSTDTQTTLPGAAAVPLADIPQSAFGQTTIDSNGNPVPPPIGLGSIGLGSIGLGSIGLGSIGLGSIGLGSIDLGSTGLGSIGLGSIGFTDATLVENGLGGIPLNTLPLKPPLSWESALSTTTLAGLPIQTLTVKDVLDRAPSTLAGIGLGSIDLSHSGLGSIGLGSIALGSIGLGSISLDSNASETTAQKLAQWCTFVHAVPGFASYDCSTLAGQTVLGLALQGVPVSSGLGSIGLGSIDLSSTGLGSIGLGSIDIADSGLGSIGLGSIGLGSIGLGSIGLGSIDLAGTGLGSIGLGSINLTSSGLGSIGLGSIGATLGNVVDCSLADCTSTTTETLGEAAAAGALKSTATLGDLATYLAGHANEFTLADLGYYGDVTLGDLAQYLTGTLADLLPGLPPTTTIDDLLSALLGGTPRDWENTPLEGLAAFAGAPGAAGGLVTYTATFTIQGQGTAAADLTVTPPSGAFYVPGSAQLVNGTQTNSPGDPLRGDGTLSWPLTSLSYGTAYTFTFKLRPGLQLGPEQTSVTLSTAGVPDTSKQASVTVTDTNEANDSATTNAAAINPATLYLSFLGNGKDVDYYKLHVDATAAPAGTQIKFFLSHLHSDDDIAVYGPGEAALRGSGLGSIGLGSIGLGSIAPGEQPVEPGEETQSLQSDPAQDLPATALPAGDQLVGVSNNRGTKSEEVDLVSTGQAQDLLIQVSSYDGNPTTDPYLLRVEYDKPPALPPCTQTAPAGPGTTEATLPTSASIPASAQTLILYNEKRFAQYYGQTNAHDVYTRLVTYAGQSTVNGVIVPVELNSAVATAYGAWDQNLCSPAAANGVVKAIGALLDTLQANHPNLTSIVLVGADNVVPFARLLDQTLQANELGFRSNFGFVNNQYVGAVAAGYLFSDDPYGDPAPRQFGNGFLYTPKYALGRLVEQPGEIEKQLDAYNANHGVINPTSKLVSGYDFLTDGAQAVDSALPGTDTATNLINDSWTADALRTDLFAPASPVIDSLNAHYDQHQALSAAGNTAHDESAPNLFTTSQLPANSVLGRIVFTMGCHSGFSLFDGLPYFPSPATNPAGFTTDWPQAYAAGGAIAFMGNTGYGLGDTTAVAYSERLNQLFAQRLNGTMTIGQALTFAKQEYFGDLGVVGTYDQKVVNEATLYGLPTYRLGTGTPPAPPATLPTRTDPTTGLTAADFTAQPTFTATPKTSPVANGGSYYQVTNDPNGLGIQVTNRRPIEPLTSLDVTQTGTTAHGVFLTSLVSDNHPGFHVAFGRVAVANSGIEPQLTGFSDFPAQIQSLVNVNTPNGLRQRAVLIAGHFASGASGNVGTQRNYTTIGGTVLYSNSADFVRPTITNMQVIQAGTTVGFSADVSDLTQTGAPGTVTEAIVLYLDGSGVWQRANLTCANGHCSGGGPLTGTSVDYIAEAVDAAGNVGVNANKAAARDITPPAGSGHIHLSLNPSTTVNGWISGSPATAVVTSDTGAALSTSLDGGPYTTTTNVPVSGDGMHVLDVRGSDGSSATFAIPVDTLPPTITFFGPGGTSFVLAGDTLFYVCADAGSGLAASGGCVGSVPSGTVTSGNQTITVNAKDNVGHTSSKSVQVWPFTGFLQPVDNAPTVNVTNAGSTIPVKFSLGGNRGLNFLAAGSPASQQVSCNTTAPVDTIETTVSAGQSSLSYDSTSNIYTYAWKTDKSWANTCRELTLTFANGDVRKAEFKFTK